MTDLNLSGRLKTVLVGKSRDLSDQSLFHKLSLIAFFAWVGLGADGLSSSCYGPEEAFKALNGHIYLSLFVAAASVVTVFIISASYSQIIELFPTRRRRLPGRQQTALAHVWGWSPARALLIDYVLTITLSVASGADALFSLLPASGLHYKLIVEVAGVCLLTLLNLRGAKEAVLPWVPIFVAFVLTHAFVIGYAPLHAPGRSCPRSGSARPPTSAPRISNWAGSAWRCWCCALTAWARAPTPASRRSATACPSCANRASRPASAPCATWPSRCPLPSPACWWVTCSFASPPKPARRSTPCCSSSLPPPGRTARRSPSSWSRSPPRPRCCSSPRRRASWTARACWPTWRWTAGSPPGSPP